MQCCCIFSCTYVDICFYSVWKTDQLSCTHAVAEQDKKLGANPCAQKSSDHLGWQKGECAMPFWALHQLADRSFFSAHKTKNQELKLNAYCFRKCVEADSHSGWAWCADWTNCVLTTWSCFWVHDCCWNHWRLNSCRSENLFENFFKNLTCTLLE